MIGRRDGQAGGSAASLATRDKQAVEIDTPWPRGSWGLDRHPEGTLAGGQTRQLQRQDLLLAGSSTFAFLSLSSAPGDTPAVRCQQSLRLPRLAAGRGAARLAALVALWTQGMKRLLPFFPSTAWEWFKAIEKDPAKPEEADKAALARFNGGYMVTGEGRDVYVARCFPELDDEVLGPVAGWPVNTLGPRSIRRWRSCNNG